MSILTQVIEGKITPQAGLAQTEQWLAKSVSNLESGLQSDPVVAQALAALQANGASALSVGSQWAGTALSGVLATLATDVEAAFAKALPGLVGTVAAGSLSAADVAVVQSADSVGQAAIAHLVASVVAAA